jgi:hypothetical protein
LLSRIVRAAQDAFCNAADEAGNVDTGRADLPARGVVTAKGSVASTSACVHLRAPDAGCGVGERKLLSGRAAARGADVGAGGVGHAGAPAS